MCFPQFLPSSFILILSACLAGSPMLAAEFSDEAKSLPSLTTLSQAEFEKLKENKSQEIWLSEEIDYATRFGYMNSNYEGATLRALINKTWPEFYATHKDPSGKDWTLKEGQEYDLTGNIRNIS